MKNVSEQLNPGGVYIFDIFNLEYLLSGDNITKLTIDWQKQFENRKCREIQYSTIEESGVLASFDIYHEKETGSEPKISNGEQTLQVYSVSELGAMMADCGLKAKKFLNIEGFEINPEKDERILAIAGLA